MAKSTPQEKARLELELINSSKEIDKFSYDMQARAMLTLYAGDIAVFVGALNKGLTTLWIAALIGLFIIPIISYFGALGPTQREFKKKHYLARKRYEVLGIDPLKLDQELKEIP